MDNICLIYAFIKLEDGNRENHSSELHMRLPRRADRNYVLIRLAQVGYIKLFIICIFFYHS